MVKPNTREPAPSLSKPEFPDPPPEKDRGLTGDPRPEQESSFTVKQGASLSASKAGVSQDTEG
ncbi:hypothetical protein LY474_10010 [Myxococcus stipitatus]|uniref:hypothetical protein n=1 Tax=Myxococcus stipitatus TaxID=83455 RepID=UPI001F29CBEA|nr:hypothetical protein [Myxococcus stipitatus]MCE9668147.1 hypothetical protein [Myxococcus stipitatus]